MCLRLKIVHGTYHMEVVELVLVWSLKTVENEERERLKSFLIFGTTILYVLYILNKILLSLSVRQIKRSASSSIQTVLFLSILN